MYKIATKKNQDMAIKTLITAQYPTGKIRDGKGKVISRQSKNEWLEHRAVLIATIRGLA